MSTDEMKALISTNEVEKLMLKIRGKDVLLDRDVAMLYGVETKRINEAVRNNPEKFPFGYIFELDKYEKKELVENFDRFNILKHSTVRQGWITEDRMRELAQPMLKNQYGQYLLKVIDEKKREIDSDTLEKR